MLIETSEQVFRQLESEVDLPPRMLENIGLVIRIMTLLRAPGGCPWDRTQTHETLLRNLLEECYEYVDTVKSGNDDKMREELGDLLLQVVFQAQVAAERGAFDLADVANDLAGKLVRRHPHVFGGQAAHNQDEALSSWNEAKSREGEEKLDMDDVPRSMPALLRARKIQERAGRVGFEWDEVGGALQKLEEELSEFRQAVISGDSSCAGEELGDLLFAVVNVARYVRQCPEVALTSATDKFQRRFAHVKKRLAEQGKTPGEATLEEMDVFWDEEKEHERSRQKRETGK